MKGEGSGGDFYIDDLSARITPTTADSLQATFRVDGVALEPDETFQLRLTTDAAIPTDETFFCGYCECDYSGSRRYFH